MWRWCECDQGSSESTNVCSRAKRSKRAELLTHFHASVKNLFGKLFCHARVVPTCNSHLLTRHRVSKIVFSGTRTRCDSKCFAKTAHASLFLHSWNSDCFSRECEKLSHPNLGFHFRSAIFFYFSTLARECAFLNANHFLRIFGIAGSGRRLINTELN